eukprot:m.83064 g.83064  ORF g.83064 m.83064 type:complete len:273 (+) comp8684_c0_seq1:69-887(+)
MMHSRFVFAVVVSCLVSCMILGFPTSALAKEHKYDHNITLTDADNNLCFKMQFDEIILSTFVSDQSSAYIVNATSGDLENVKGNCFQFTEIGKTGNYSLTADVSFDLVIKDDSLSFAFHFLQNATYSSNNTNTHSIFGDNSSALHEIDVVLTHATKQYTVNFEDMLDFDFAMDYNTSYLCNYNFTYSSNHSSPITKKSNSSLAIKNIRLQPFILPKQDAYSPTNDDSYCPVDDSEIKTIGLIVGGTLTGIALLGIVLFTISTFRDKGYERIH